MERSTNAYYDLVKGAVEAFNERIQCYMIAGVMTIMLHFTR